MDIITKRRKELEEGVSGAVTVINCTKSIITILVDFTETMALELVYIRDTVDHSISTYYGFCIV